MSTSYMIESELKRAVACTNLDMKLISDQHREYRIMIRETILFQGHVDRCSDFVRGYLARGDHG